MIHCKKCRNNRAESEFKIEHRNYKTCNSCRVSKHSTRLTIEDCKVFAQSKDGLCLSEIYINARTVLNWQ